MCSSDLKVVSRRFGQGATNIDRYVELDGYKAVQKALAMEPDAIINEVKNSGLRGRGGAGFSTGMKWSFVPKQSAKPKYVLCNGDESEPGTCKDRLIFEHDPHAVIEGVMIGGFALVASPAEYRVTGVKTFIVSNDGVVYEKDLGPSTLDEFKKMERFNPDKTWTPVEED